MPPPKVPTRGQQFTTKGLGQCFTSPRRRARPDQKQPLEPLGREAKRRRLLQKLERLLNNDEEVSTPSNDPSVSHEDHSHPPEVEPLPLDCNDEPPRPRRIIPDGATHMLYDKWKLVLPRLVDALLTFVTRTTGKILSPPTNLQTTCSELNCPKRTNTIVCLFQDYFQTIEIVSCQCQDLLYTLVVNGLFPTAPTSPRMAVSILLLEFYTALFERSCDAIHALAGALNTFYKRRGFIPLNRQGEPMPDAFRRGLGYAVQWYDNLRTYLEKRVDDAVVAAGVLLEDEAKRPSIVPLAPGDAKVRTEGLTGEGPPGLIRGKCARILVQRCPACFGGIWFGRSSDQGHDIHLGTDGNFNHRHLISAGDCPKFFEPEYFLPKEQVDAVGHRIDALRKRPAKHHNSRVPNEAVDECESSHVAGCGSNSKTNMEKFDDGGVMVLICRHDIPLFLANIDTPGEQQKYSIALIEHVFSFLPPTATVGLTYDVGCVLDRSLQLYDFLPKHITDRLTFATSAMHAYAHQWACQLVYNPRIRLGFGLTDGEGVERLWSRSRKLIGITRVCARTRQIWMLDRHMASINEELRDDLGNWMERRRKKGVEGQGKKAQKVLDECGVSLPYLREQWALQQTAQLSLRAHSPARLKKELDMVLGLQGDLDTVDKAIRLTRDTISKATTSKESLHLLSALETTQQQLKEKAEALYASLNIGDAFPELQNIDLEFVRVLLMARDLKINIRKRAIGSFFEWDKLDQAAGGREQAIGTKLHQATQQAISKRKPALMNAIRKFNRYCETLATLHNSEWAIPLPEALPTQLASLRECPHLMQDVWISPSPRSVPAWLESIDVREGIRAMLKLDRCREEFRRLGLEGDNLCRWFGQELSALEVAIATPSNANLLVLLHHRRDHIIRLKKSYAGTLTGIIRYEYHIKNSQVLAQHLTRTYVPSYTWITPKVSSLVVDHLLAGSQDSNDSTFPEGIDEIQPVYVESDTAIFEDFLMLEEAPVDGALNVDFEDLGPVVTNGAPLIWALPEGLIKDLKPLAGLLFQTLAPPSPPTVPRRFRHSLGVITFSGQELAIMESPTAWLNDVCINGIAQYLHAILSHPTSSVSHHSSRCALFSTFDLLMSRYNANDDTIWRRTQKLEFWTKDIWILPIHRHNPKHWVLCTIYLSSRRLYLFDSLAAKNPWKHEVPEIIQLVKRLVVLSNQNGYPLGIITEEGWTACPVLIHRTQTNNHDCGIFVLANVLAVLRGCHVSGATQMQMGNLRQLLYNHLLFLPTNV